MGFWPWCALLVKSYPSGPVAPRPVPAPKPQVRQRPQRPQVEALYDYTATDHDEISITEGEILELVKEGR